MHDEQKPAVAAEPGGSKLPPSDSQADRLLRLVHWTSAASRHLRRRLAEVAEAFDLSDTELLVVWLCSGGGRVQVDLAGAIGISPAQMSGMVERLRSRGLVAMHRWRWTVADRFGGRRRRSERCCRRRRTTAMSSRLASAAD